MSDELERVGVRLVAEGEDTFMRVMNDMQKQVTEAVQAVSKLTDALNDASSGGINNTVSSMGELSQQTLAASQSTEGLTAKTLTLASAMGNILAQAFFQVLAYAKQLSQKFLQIGKDALVVSSRFQQTTLASYLMGKRMGFTTDQVQGFIDGLREAGIQADVATNLILEMSRAGLDLSKSVELARVAQNAAVVAGRDSSDTLSRLTYGIMTYNTMILRSAGITITGNQAMGEYAKELGKSTQQLTAAEKQQAMFNAVLKEGEKIIGFYELSMQNANKVLGSIPRVMNDVLIALGTPFEKAFFNVVNTVYKGLGMVSEALGKDIPTAAQKADMAFKKAVDSGEDVSLVMADMYAEVDKATAHVGVMKETLESAGAVLGWFAEKMAGLGREGIQKALIGMGNFAQRMQSFATNAFSWGWNLIQQYGAGIIQAAGSILVNAMNFVTRILTSWMKPGSPPKILPDIDKWGGSTLQEWLHGMTTADFSVLNQVSSTIEQMFRAMGDAFDPAKMLDIEKGLITAFNTGQVDPSLISQLTSTLGEYGNEVADLVTKQVQLASALNEVARAEDELNKVREEADALHEKISEAVEDYNKAVRAGADPEVLKAKRDAIRADQEALKVKQDEVDEAGDAYKAAVKEAGPLQKQVQLQEQLIQQIIRMLDLQEQTRKAQEELEGGGDGGDTGAELEEPDLGGDLSDIEGILPGMSDLENAIREVLDGWWQEVVTWYTDKIKPTLDMITGAWETMVGAIKQFWDDSGIGDTIINTWDRVKEAFGDAMPNILNNLLLSWEGFLDGLATGLENSGEDVQGIIDSINGFIEVAGLFAEDVIKAFEQISEYLPGFSGTTGEIIGGLLATFLEWGNELLAFVLPKVQEFEKKVRAWLDEGGLKTVLENVQTAWDNFKSALESPIGQAVIKGFLTILAVIKGLNLAIGVAEIVFGGLGKVLGFIGLKLAPVGKALLWVRDAFVLAGLSVGWISGIIESLYVTIGVFLLELNPVILVITAIIAIIAALAIAWKKDFLGMKTTLQTTLAPAIENFKKKWEEIKESLAQGWETIKQSFNDAKAKIMPALDKLKEAFGKLIDAVGPLWESMKELWETFKQSSFVQNTLDNLNKLVIWLQNVFGGIIKWLIGVISESIGQAIGFFGGIIQAVIGAVSGIITAITGVIQFITGFFQLLVGLFTGNGEKITDALAKMMEGLITIGMGIWEGLVGIFTGLWESVKSLFGKLVENVIQFFTNLWNELVGHSIIPDMVNAIIEWFINLKDKVVEWVTNLVNTVVQWFKDLWTDVTEKVKDIWIKVVEYFKNLYNDVTAKVDELWTKVVEFFTNLWIDVTEKANQIWTDVVQYFTDTYNDVTAKVSELWTDVVQFFTNLYDDVTAKVEELWDDIKTAVEGGVEDFTELVDGLIQDVISFFTETDWMQVGKDVVQGIADGITSATNIIWEAVKGLGGSLLEAIKTFLKIDSPSKVAAMEIGRPFAEGIAMGITGSMSRVNQAVVRAMSGTVSPAMAGGAVQTGTRIVENNNTRQYNLSVVTNQSPSVIVQSFEVMEAVSI